jgi:dipeptidyl aminopeptidase/acylaminoacyl peptidase
VKTSQRGVYDRGYLFYDRDGFTIAQRFDPSTGQLQGEPVRTTREVAPGAGHLGYLPLAAGGGHIAVAMSARAQRQLAWKTGRGEPAGNLGDPAEQQEFDLSPDGKRLAISRRASNQIDRNIWIVDTRSGASRRVTNGWNDYGPVWSPDGRRIAFTSTRGLGNNLYVVDADNLQGEIPLVEREASLSPIGWAGDNRFVWSMATSLDLDPKTYGIFTSAPGAGPREPGVSFRVGETVSGARLSPDGTHIAYASSSTGRPEVYVDTFPKPSKPVAVSVAGGSSPRWHPDGRKLYFVARNELMVAAMQPGATAVPNPTWVLTLPSSARWYGVDSTSRVLVLVPTSVTPPSLKLTFNWFSSQAARD